FVESEPGGRMRRLKLMYILSLCTTGLLLAGCQHASDAGAPASAKDTSTAPAASAEEFRELTIPASATMTVALDSSVGSATSHADDPVRAHVTKPVSVDGAVVVPVGSNMSGAVVEAVQSGRVKGLAHVVIRFDTLRPAGDGETYTIRTAEITRSAKSE